MADSRGRFPPPRRSWIPVFTGMTVLAAEGSPPSRGRLQSEEGDSRLHGNDGGGGASRPRFCGDDC